MYALGQAITLEIKRGWFRRDTLPIDAALGFEVSMIDTLRNEAHGRLVLEANDPATQTLLGEAMGLRVARLVYRTGRYDGPKHEIGQRADARPFEHSFTARPELQWSHALQAFVLSNVTVTTNQLYEPAQIAS